MDGYTFARSIRRSGAQADTANLPIATAPVPPSAIISLAGSTGAAARCLVRPGQRVAEGDRIGAALGAGTRNVHASIPGLVSAVLQQRTAAGGSALAVHIDLGGSFRLTGAPSTDTGTATDWQDMATADLRQRLQAAGVEPSWSSPDATVVVVCLLPPDPYVTSRSRVLVEQTDRVLTGLQIVRHAYRPQRVLVVAEPAVRRNIAAEQAVAALAQLPDVEVVRVRLLPLADPHLILSATERRLRPASPAPALAATAALWEPQMLVAAGAAVMQQRPVLDRVVTVAGDAVRQPRNVRLRIGAPARLAVEECGGLRDGPVRLVLGGVLRGQEVADLDVPVAADVDAVLALGRRTSMRTQRQPDPCVRCGACAEVCPARLDPQYLHDLIGTGELHAARTAGLAQCGECGYCTLVCPSGIELARRLTAGKTVAA